MKPRGKFAKFLGLGGALSVVLLALDVGASTDAKHYSGLTCFSWDDYLKSTTVFRADPDNYTFMHAYCAVTKDKKTSDIEYAEMRVDSGVARGECSVMQQVEKDYWVGKVGHCRNR